MTTIESRRLHRLLRGMLDIYSPTGKEEQVVNFVLSALRKAGLPAVRQPVDQRRSNVIVAPRGREVSLALVGHLDTVTAPDVEDFAARVEGDQVFGLGAADMKGGCAALIEACLAWWEAGRTTDPFALCLVVGEEENGDGAAQLVEELSVSWALVAEPTDLQPCLSHYGYLELELQALGERRHASLAPQNENAVEVMLRRLLAISDHLQRERGDVVYNIRDVSSGPGGFVVPARCEAFLDLHLPPGAPAGAILTELEEIVLSEQLASGTVRTSFNVGTIHAGYDLPEKGRLVKALQQVYAERGLPWSPSPFRSHSDANVLWAAGIRPVVLGPGQLEQAHAANEAVSFSQVRDAAQLYLSVLEHFFDRV